jgi:hypothetical protein
VTIESARQIDAYYSGHAARGALSDYHMRRWMRARDYLATNDDAYIWED